MSFEDRKLRPWPIRPIHVTNDGQENGLSGQGIITNRHLQGQQAEISDVVGYPTTIIEFAPNGDPVRTDSPFLDLAMHPACQLFREKNTELSANGERVPGALCRDCDKCHAGLFRNLKSEDLSISKINDQKELSVCIKKWYADNPRCSFEPKIDQETNRLFLQYDCPLLGFRELIFPVIFEERVIAVFFVGQLILPGKEKFIEEMIMSVGRRYPACFNEVKQAAKVPREILRKHKDWLAEKPNERILGEIRYETIIRNTLKELRNFEHILEEELQHQRVAYIRRYISGEIEEFGKSTASSKEHATVGDESSLGELWGRVQQSMTNLVGHFSLRYALVFGVRRVINTEEDMLTVQAKTARYSEVLPEEELAELALNCANLPEEYTVCSRSKLENSQYLSALKGPVSKLGDFQLVLVPVRAHPHSSIAILLGYDDDYPSSETENKPGRDLDLTLQSFFTLVVSTLAATLAHGAGDLAKKQLLYLGHEAGQLVAGLDWLRLSYEDASGLENRLNKDHGANHFLMMKGFKKKIEDLCQDIGGFTGQMSFFFDNAQRLGTDKLPEVKPTEFMPFGDVLFKWKDSYRHESEKKRLQLRVEEPEMFKGSRSNDPWRPVMFGDKFLFEQVVYNLMNNAEKYCHRGTKIMIDCKLESLTKGAPYVLSVTDYGIEMAPGDDVYKPFKRRESMEDAGGLGLGLFIAWVIIEQVYHGIIKHTSEQISKFNIPLITPYIERSFAGKNFALQENLVKERERLLEERLYDGVVAFETEMETKPGQTSRKPRYIPTDEVLRNEINKPTNKVTITAKMPDLERSN